MIIKRIAVAAAATAVALTVTTGAAAQTSDEAPAAPHPGNQSASPAPSGFMRDELVQVVKEAVAADIGKDVLFDYSVDNDTGTFIVHRTEASPADAQWKALGEANGVKVELETSKWTMDQAKERVSEIDADQGLWTGVQGFEVSSVGYLPDGVNVYVREGLEQARTYFSDVDDVLSVQYREILAF